MKSRLSIRHRSAIDGLRTQGFHRGKTRLDGLGQPELEIGSRLSAHAAHDQGAFHASECVAIALGQKLLQRSNIGVTPTEAGSELYRHPACRALLSCGKPGRGRKVGSLGVPWQVLTKGLLALTRRSQSLTISLKPPQNMRLPSNGVEFGSMWAIRGSAITFLFTASR